MTWSSHSQVGDNPEASAFQWVAKLTCPSDVSITNDKPHFYYWYMYSLISMWPYEMWWV